MDDIRFTLTEFLSFIGVVQCVFILVFIAFRSKYFHKTLIPFIYFLCLGLLFLADFGRGFIGKSIFFYEAAVLWLWFTGISLSVLVVMHIAYGRLVNRFRPILLILLPAISLVFARGAAMFYGECTGTIWTCPAVYNWFVLGGIVSSALALLCLWLDKDLFSGLRQQKFGQEKYWLVLTIIISNMIAIAVMFMSLQSDRPASDIIHIRILLGLAFVYLVTTSLFRLYPYLSQAQEEKSGVDLSAQDQALAQKIEQLFELDKVYQEAGFNRASLAKELDVAEVNISRIINSHFAKSLPQLLNEYRIRDAKALLEQTDMPVAAIAQEAGFSSLATFNRVFRDVVGQPPSTYRQELKKLI